MEELKLNIADGLGTNIRIGSDIANLIVDFAFDECYFCKNKTMEYKLRTCYKKGQTHSRVYGCIDCIKLNNFKLCYLCMHYNDDVLRIATPLIENVQQLMNLCRECIDIRDTYYYCKILDVAIGISDNILSIDIDLHPFLDSDSD